MALTALRTAAPGRPACTPCAGATRALAPARLRVPLPGALSRPSLPQIRRSSAAPAPGAGAGSGAGSPASLPPLERLRALMAQGSDLQLALVPAVAGPEGPIREGSRVRVRPGVLRPTFGWGSVRPGSVGEVTELRMCEGRQECEVEFPEQCHWTGVVSEMEPAVPLRKGGPPGPPTLHASSRAAAVGGLAVGSRVGVKPGRRWGYARPGSVGTLTGLSPNGNWCKAEFPEEVDWVGATADLEPVVILSMASPQIAEVLRANPSADVLVVEGDTEAWEQLLLRVYPGIKDSERRLRGAAVLKMVPLARKYGFAAVLEDCTALARGFTFSAKPGSRMNAARWLELLPYEDSRPAQYIAHLMLQYARDPLRNTTLTQDDLFRSFKAAPPPATYEELVMALGFMARVVDP